jgi:hypothetical protein
MALKKFIFLFAFMPTQLLAQPEAGQGRVGFGCGFAPMPSEAVTRVTNLLEKNDFQAVAGLVQSDNNAERYLAVIAIERLSRLALYKPSASDLEWISKAKHSKAKVSICSGCFDMGKISLKQLLASPELLGSNEWLDAVIAAK